MAQSRNQKSFGVKNKTKSSAIDGSEFEDKKEFQGIQPISNFTLKSEIICQSYRLNQVGRNQNDKMQMYFQNNKDLAKHVQVDLTLSNG